MAGPDRDFSDLFTRRRPVILVHKIAVKLIHLIMEQLSHPLATHTPIDPMVATFLVPEVGCVMSSWMGWFFLGFVR